MRNEVMKQEIRAKFGTLVDAAKAMGVSKQAISQWITTGHIPEKHVVAFGLNPTFALKQSTAKLLRVYQPGTQVDINSLTVAEARRLYEELHAVFGGPNAQA